jgi:hypothetical protein
MSLSKIFGILGRVVPVAALLVGLAVPAKASPILIGSLTVTEHELPNPDLVDPVTIVPGPEIVSGDATNIGSVLLLRGEYIDIGPTSIVFSIRGNGTTNSGGHPAGFFDTGYTFPAEYQFTNIGFDVPGQIVGLTFGLSQISDFGLTDLSFTNNSIIVHVGGLGVAGGVNTSNLGVLTVGIETQATNPPPSVPEPATLTLLGLGLAAAARKRLIS